MLEGKGVNAGECRSSKKEQSRFEDGYVKWLGSRSGGISITAQLKTSDQGDSAEESVRSVQWFRAHHLKIYNNNGR